MKHENIDIHGAGMTGAACAYFLRLAGGYDVTVFEKDAVVGGHCKSIKVRGVVAEAHGIHCFHTNDWRMWRWITSLAKFRWYIHRAKCVTDHGTFPWPITMESIERHPLRDQIIKELSDRPNTPQGATFADWCVDLVGKTLYETFIEGYTLKQWGTTDIDISFAPKRISFREDNNDNYFLDKYQGVPIDGFSEVIERMLDGTDVRLKTPGEFRGNLNIYTGSPDKILDYKHGVLPYRSLKFKFQIHDLLAEDIMLPAPQVNYATQREEFTRQTEPRQYTGQWVDSTVVIKEYPGGKGKYYPMPTQEAKLMFNKYKEEIDARGDIILAGRLGNYEYINMDECIERAAEIVSGITGYTVDQLWEMALEDRKEHFKTIL